MSSPINGSAGSHGAGASARQVAILAPLVVGAVWILDQLSKAWAEHSLVENQSVPWIGQLLQFHLIYNSGAAFSLGAGSTVMITIIQILIAAAIIFGLVTRVRSFPWVLALALLLGGALGNVFDRIFRAPGPFRGYVVDFLELPHWPIFNIADIAVTSGAIILVLVSLMNIPAAGRVAVDPEVTTALSEETKAGA